MKERSYQSPGQHPPNTVNWTHPTGNTNKYNGISLIIIYTVIGKSNAKDIQVSLN